MKHDYSNFEVQQNIPYFDGYCHAESFIYWFRKVDNFFEFYTGIPEEKEVKYVARKLYGYASTWWEKLQANRRREFKQPIRTWLRMRKLMSTRFLQTNHGKMLYEEYRRKFESKQMFQDNFDLQYSHVTVDTNCSRNKPMSLMTQLSSEGQNMSKVLSSSSQLFHNGFGVSKHGDQLQVDEVEENKSDTELRTEVSQERTSDDGDGKDNGEALELKEHELPIVDLACSDPHDYKTDCRDEVPHILWKFEGPELVKGQDNLQYQHKARFIDFLGVQQFDWVPSIHLVHLVNKLKHEEKRSLHEYFSFNDFWKTSVPSKFKYSKYLFLWKGRWQVSNENSRASSFDSSSSIDVGQKWRVFVFYFYCFRIRF
ncbi:hypothetical protein RHGRI_036121 [Rhododendron griersonianum]|uniref:Retrotransposon gag domain-containing protein n=1 Tax=Rhododendron griersonianum TaxID=479676 RepID=A0AAV6HSH9_9ERIC|nr:hypothetical protein RHGRI_036121 [Rhododendron griersonianum]